LYFYADTKIGIVFYLRKCIFFAFLFFNQTDAIGYLSGRRLAKIRRGGKKRPQKKLSIFSLAACLMGKNEFIS
jgi:hypothetical protein